MSKFQEHFAHSSTQARTFERDSVMLTINTNERRGHVVVFNYGAVVFVNVIHCETGAWTPSRRSAEIRSRQASNLSKIIR